MWNNCFKAIVLALFSCWLAADTETARAQVIPLITLTNLWRYNQTGENLGTEWRAANYDDTVAGWDGPGLALFGYETDETQYNTAFGVAFNTRFPGPQSSYPDNFRTNYYFRTHFTMPSYSTGILAATTLTTTNWFDDGVVYYLNGVELLRTNMPNGTISATTLSLPALAEPIQRVISNLGTNLVIGLNTFAVELHQFSTNSSDAVFGMTMTATVPTPPVITIQPVGQTNVIGSTVTLSVTATGGNPLSYQWFSNSVTISGATSNSYTVPSAVAFAADYTVTVSNIFNSTTSAVVHVAIVIDTFPPTLVSAFTGPLPPSRLSNQVDVIFSELMDNGPAATDPNSGLNTNHYLISILGTTNTIPVTLAQVSGVVPLVRLTTPTFFMPGTNYVLTVNGVADRHANIIAANSQIGIGIITANPPPPASPLTNLFSFGQTWTYSEPAHDIPSTWTSTNFVGDLDFSCPDTNCWASGQGVFYFEPNSSPCTGATLQGGPLDPLKVFYFRTAFVAPSNTLPSGVLYMTNFFDDGLIIYLNGTEIYRTDMPTGAVSVSTTALSQIAPICSYRLISVTNLMMPPPATNVLAAELHESGNPNDFDIYFGLSLSYSNSSVFSAYSTNISPLPPRISVVPQATTPTNIISWTTNVGGYHWGLDTTTNLGSNANWTSLTNGSPYTNTISGSRFFRLHAN